MTRSIRKPQQQRWRVWLAALLLLLGQTLALAHAGSHALDDLLDADADRCVSCKLAVDAAGAPPAACPRLVSLHWTRVARPRAATTPTQRGVPHRPRSRGPPQLLFARLA